jgi:hypothetical protein
MEEFLKQFVGRQVDISFGTSGMIRGSVIEVSNGIVYLEDEHKRKAYVMSDKINAVWETDDVMMRPGFVV